MSELLTLDDIAAMHRCSTSQAEKALVTLPGFPAGKECGGRMVWDYQEVWNFVNRKPLNEPGEYCLYRHFDANGILLYVGISLSAVHRLGQHRNTSHWAKAIVRIEIERHPSREVAALAEEAAIRAEKPLHNIAHNTGAKAKMPTVNLGHLLPRGQDGSPLVRFFSERRKTPKVRP